MPAFITAQVVLVAVVVVLATWAILGYNALGARIRRVERSTWRR